ncbi:hypothetical protein S14_62 [Shewanella sp. phage 1/4]|uniref:ATPase n=1 Tax=Shewanella phage 1/4 TaxID=1458859 RepID=UPI0004F5EA7F|nr:ATPase [Shewanella sp. phage 1/4]AHK11174.1 hypothetical protein S14_62 [Shewanella sp. phage 1/4]
MRELVEGVTRIRYIDASRWGISDKGVLVYYRNGEGAITQWKDAEGGIHNWYLDAGEGIGWEFVEEGNITHRDLDMTLTIIPSDAVSEYSNWTDKHYDHYLTVKLTPEEIAAGEVKVKVDPYVVNELWGINTADKTGAGFHCLKTLSRMANAKNSLEREWDALIGQSTRARELLNK